MRALSSPVECEVGSVFERYTERARRAIFFPHMQASELGSPRIEPEHLLLGVIREGAHFPSLRGDAPLARRGPQTSRGAPFSPECRRVLDHAADEAKRLDHNYIGTKHLLLGLLREEDGLAGAILGEHGIRLDPVREEIRALTRRERLDR